MYVFLQGILFLFRISSVFVWEGISYSIFNDYISFIKNVTTSLARINILYVKIFQAFALNNKMISEEMNNELLSFTDHAPWSNDDVNVESLINLSLNNNIEYDFTFLYNPINAGMISLVYKTYWEDKKTDIIIKVKRKNIESKLNSAIDQLLFFIQFLSWFPIFNQFNLVELIQKNIEIIQHQLCFQEEVDNMIKIRENCKNLKYIKIPEVYPEFTAEDPNIIIMEYVEGITITDIQEEDYEPFAKQVLKFGFVTTILHGFTHGDLHAGNILFIKDLNDSVTPYKLGILDFGIMYLIDKTFKETLFEISSDLFSEPPEKIAQKMLHSGIIVQPLNIIQSLDQEHSQYILDIMTFSLNETLHRNKDGNQIRLYDFIYNLHSYLQKHSLKSLGLYLSDDFVKTQLVLAMAHGVTMKLCKENYIGLADRVINELFHTELLT
jgi:ubiquinone biosynthesis protein